MKKNSTIYLQINCNDTEAKELRIALPNSLRLANTENLKGYWIMNNAIDYISVYKQKGYSSIKIPLIVTLDGITSLSVTFASPVTVTSFVPVSL